LVEGAHVVRTEWSEDVSGFYGSPAVRGRIAEYCGGTAESPETFTCSRIAAFGGRDRLTEAEGAPVPHDKTSWPRLLGDGVDICRALADRRGTLIQLDVDYVDYQEPGAPYRRPEETFARLEPVYRVLRELFARYGVPNRALVTGRGYHLTTRVPFGSPFQAGLVGISRLSDSLVARYAGRARADRSADLMGWGHEGAGRLLEHLVHRALHLLRGKTEVPVTLADLPPPDGGPFVCLDLTAYADPVFERHARCAFSANQRSAMIHAAPERPFVIVLPRGDEPMGEILERREDPALAAELADGADATIPDATDGQAWIDDYGRGPVGRFHAEFDRGPQAEPGAWPFTYDTIDAEEWPPCVSLPLRHPNPALLQPAYIRTVALSLWTMGWHPRSIAGLVRSKYEREYGWGTLWLRYDAATRAEFYVRLFCGAVADGLDGAADFTCATQAGRGVCGSHRCREDQATLFEWLGSRLEGKGGLAASREHR
jgi:hypothetical protein